MSRLPPDLNPTIDEVIAELRETLMGCIDRVHAGGGVVTCTGLDGDTFDALHRHAVAERSPAALAAVRAAAERHIAGTRLT